MLEEIFQVLAALLLIFAIGLLVSLVVYVIGEFLRKIGLAIRVLISGQMNPRCQTDAFGQPDRDQCLAASPEHARCSDTMSTEPRSSAGSSGLLDYVRHRAAARAEVPLLPVEREPGSSPSRLRRIVQINQLQDPCNASASQHRHARRGRPSKKRNRPAHQARTAFSCDQFDFRDLNGFSPLSVHGYRTGKTSDLLPRERRERLVRATEEHLPNIYADVRALEIWGSPGTRRRQLRIADFLEWLIRRDEPTQRLRQAVSDRKADLDWYVDHYGLERTDAARLTR